MLERKDLKLGGRYSYQDKGMSDPEVVVIEKMGPEEVACRLGRNGVERSFQIETFLNQASVVVRLNISLGG